MLTCSPSQDTTDWGDTEVVLQRSPRRRGQPGGCLARPLPLHADAPLRCVLTRTLPGTCWGGKPTLGVSSNSSHLHVPQAHWWLGLQVPNIMGTELGPSS